MQHEIEQDDKFLDKFLFDVTGPPPEGIVKTDAGLYIPQKVREPEDQKRYKIVADTLIIPYNQDDRGQGYIHSSEQPYITENELAELGMCVNYLIDTGMIALDGYEKVSYDPTVRKIEAQPKWETEKIYAPSHVMGPIPGQEPG